MLKNRLVLFVAKKVLLFYGLLAILDLLLLPHKWLVLVGLSIGTSFALIRLNSMAASFSAAFSHEKWPHTVILHSTKYIISQIAVLALLTASLIYSKWLFAGTAAGLLLVSAVIMLNGITEGIGITHNNFE